MGNSQILLVIIALLLSCFNGVCFSATDADAYSSPDLASYVYASPSPPPPPPNEYDSPSPSPTLPYKSLESPSPSHLPPYLYKSPPLPTPVYEPPYVYKSPPPPYVYSSPLMSTPPPYIYSSAPYVYSSRPSPVKSLPPPYDYHTSPATGIRGVVLADLPTTYCVAKSFGTDQDTMLTALSWACAMVDCSKLQQGKPCFEPDTIPAHASFAFNLYYQHSGLTGTCDFNGTAMVTTTDPSHGSCIFPGYTSVPTTTSPGFRFRATGALVMVWMTMTLFY